MGRVEWGKAEIDEKEIYKNSKDFEFDLGVIDATNNNEELYEKLLDKFMDKAGIKKEIESGRIVILSGLSERKINALLSSYRNLEWSVGLVGRFDDKIGAYFVHDVVVCEQEVSKTSVELTTEGNREFAKVKGIIGWCHSHNDMDSFHSSTDIGTTSTFGLGMTVNNKREFDVKIRKDLSIGISILVEGRVFRENEILNDVLDWVEDAKSKIKEKTHTITNYSYGMRCYDKKEEEEGLIVENECAYCYQKLPKSKSKRAECILCGLEMHMKCIRKISEEGDMCEDCASEEDFYKEGCNSSFIPSAEDYRYSD